MIRAAALGLSVLSAVPALAAEKLNARDSALIQDCIKTAGGAEKAERCIGKLSNPCLDKDSTRSTAAMTACIDREQAVWDDILNETYRRLRAKLDAQQQDKLREMQRAWIMSRDKTCAFYWDYFQGTMATPMRALCNNREIARRALFLVGFLEDTETK